MDPVIVRLLTVIAIVAIAIVIGWWWRARDGRMATTSVTSQRLLDRRHLDALGLDLRGVQAGAVLIGSPTCAPCETTKDLLGDLEREREGFVWAYADAANHLELTEEHRILRVPTLLVLAPDGRIVARSSGVPRIEDLRRAVDDQLRLAA